jgi:hypothetical protein
MRWVSGLIGGYLRVPLADRGGVMPLYVTVETIKRTTKRIGGVFKLSDKTHIRWKIAKGGVIQCYGGDPRTYVIVQRRIDAIVGHWEDE